MKLHTVILILVLVAPWQLFAGPLFREVRIGSDSWEVTFHESGGRYHIQINDVDRGTSGYLQRLVILNSESLRLIDKHWFMDIKPSEQDGLRGIEIVRTYIDRLSGEQKVDKSFEAEHKIETK
jgi:hypothetical protein